MGASRFTMEQVQRIFEVEAPRFFPGVSLARTADDPTVYEHGGVNRLWQLWREAWTICEYNIPPNIESITHEELEDEAYRRFGRIADRYETIFMTRERKGENDETNNDN